MACWPECSPWCECIDGKCQPTPVQVNAVRLRTLDGRYLQAVNGGRDRLWATNVVPHNWETFLLASFPPHGSITAMWPLASGNRITLDLCSSNWGSSSDLVCVDVTGDYGPYIIIDIQFGGPGAFASLEYYTYEMQCVLLIEKAGGGSITTGDEISLSTWSNFYLRPESAQDPAYIMADGTTPFPFVVEFSEVRAGLGWRPSSVNCQAGATVKGTITDASTSQPIVGAVVEALGVLDRQQFRFSASTGNFGEFTLTTIVDRYEKDCVPEGNVVLTTTADQYQTNVIDPFTVPGEGEVVVNITLQHLITLETSQDYAPPHHHPNIPHPSP
jgi:hypothetical protein